MQKIIGLFILTCCFSAGLAVRCYSCSDCKKAQITEEICPSEAPYCGKFSVIAELNGNHVETVSKGCFPERRGQTCEAFMQEGMTRSGLFTPQQLEFTRQTLQRPEVSVTCDFCRDRDLCNSSNGILITKSVFFVMAILAKLF